MDTKYYTPSIEEFHVSFECERNNINESDFHKDLYLWESHTLSKEDLIQIGVYTEDRLNRRYRAKYLDKEDIESLGWVYNDNSTIYSEEKNNRKLMYSSNYHIVRIWRNEGNVGFSDTIFEGIINNKSELKRILKQLGI